jgi:hypothetical protein
MISLFQSGWILLTLFELFQMQLPDVQDVSVFSILTTGSTLNLSAPVCLRHDPNLQLLKQDYKITPISKNNIIDLVLNSLQHS